MPRRPRLYLPGQPQHVVVRGHNRDPILARHEDFRFLYRCLHEAADRHGLAVYAWVFMHNHLHLLATPADEHALPRAMQTLGRRYVQYFNRSYRRSVALWEGRYKSALVDTERYLLACYRYIELNPVRAGIARRPEDYPYSSFHANALGKPDAVVTPHLVFLGLIGAGAPGSESAAPTPTPSRHPRPGHRGRRPRRRRPHGPGGGSPLAGRHHRDRLDRQRRLE
jgi:putative transposase